MVRQLTYDSETPVLFKNHHGKGRQNERATRDHGAQLPSDLSLARSRVDPLHDTKDVERGQDVEDLEAKVPRRALLEDVEISGAEDGGVQDLGDEGDTLGAAVSVDGEDQDELGEHVGQVAQHAKDLM